ncbi:hypothetical protein Tco_0103062 [Tanacetum coccineum]
METASRVNRDAVSTVYENKFFVFDEKFPALDSTSASSSPKSIHFTLNTNLVIPSPAAIMAILQSITALAVAMDPFPTSKGVSGSFSYRVKNEQDKTGWVPSLGFLTVYYGSVLLLSEQDELPSSVGLNFRARLDGGQMYSGHLEAMRLP